MIKTILLKCFSFIVLLLLCSCQTSTPTIDPCNEISVKKWLDESTAIMDSFDNISISSARESYGKQINVSTPECLNVLQAQSLNFYDYSEERLLAIEKGDYELANHYLDKIVEAIAIIQVKSSLLMNEYGW